MRIGPAIPDTLGDSHFEKGIRRELFETLPRHRVVLLRTAGFGGSGLVESRDPNCHRPDNSRHVPGRFEVDDPNR